MNAQQYKRLINQKNVLDHTTLNVTLKELTLRREFELVEAIKLILVNNQIVKPSLHGDPYNVSTTYYKVDLSSDDVDKIIDIFFELEAAHVGKHGESTPTTSFYTSLVDRWNKIAEG